MPPAVQSFRRQAIDNLATQLQTIISGTEFFNTVKTVSKDEGVIVKDDFDNWPIIIVTANEMEGQQFQATNEEITERFQVKITGLIQVPIGQIHNDVGEEWMHDLIKAVESDPRLGTIQPSGNKLADTVTVDKKTLLWDSPSEQIQADLEITISWIRDSGSP